MTTIAFFNNRGDHRKTSLVYHLAWMYRDLGLSVVAADLDPQANLTAMFLDEAQIASLWPDQAPTRSVLHPLLPLLKGEGGIGDPELWDVQDIGLLAGDLGLSGFEDDFSQEWPNCLDGKRRAFRVIAGFHEVLRRAAEQREADVVLLDVGPNLGAINRAALIAADHVIIPLSPDLFSLRGLQSLGPRLRQWRGAWRERLKKAPEGISLPPGKMEPRGYVVMQHAMRLDRPMKVYAECVDRIPQVYSREVLDREPQAKVTLQSDPHCLATLKHYHTLMSIAQEAGKPMFALKAGDGVVGGHVQAVQDCDHEFRALAQEIARRTGVSLPAGVG